MYVRARVCVCVCIMVLRQEKNPEARSYKSRKPKTYSAVIKNKHHLQRPERINPVPASGVGGGVGGASCDPWLLFDTTCTS